MHHQLQYLSTSAEFNYRKAVAFLAQLPKQKTAYLKQGEIINAELSPSMSGGSWAAQNTLVTGLQAAIRMGSAYQDLSAHKDNIINS